MPEEDRTAELELAINGDAAIASEVLQGFDVTMTTTKPTRFIAEAGVVIGVASGLVKLISALIDLSAKLRKNPEAPRVTARNVAGDQLILNHADDQAIASFVRASAE